MEILTEDSQESPRPAMVEERHRKEARRTKGTLSVVVGPLQWMLEESFRKLMGFSMDLTDLFTFRQEMKLGGKKGRNN